MIFVGDDWSEDHHDVEVMDERGRVLVKRRLAEGVTGVTALHALIADHAEDPALVAVGIETDRGLWVASLVGAGYTVYAVNPLAVSRYRDRHNPSGAKSDAGDAHVLADLVRTDRHQHRPVAGDSAEASAVKVLARAHQRLIWDRTRQTNRLRSALREYFPAALAAFEDLSHPDALGILGRAPTPEAAAKLSTSAIAAGLRRAGRKRNVERRAGELQRLLRGERLDFPAVVADAYGAQVRAAVAVIGELNRQIATLEGELDSRFSAHPDAEIIRSLPGLGSVLGARVLGEFGDDPNRYQDARARKNYAGTSPTTKTSGKKRSVAARFMRNRYLADACYQWAFCALSPSPGARAFYDQHRAKGDTHDQALRALSNRLVGVLDGCLRSHTLYDETKAWGHRCPSSEGQAA